MFDEERMTRLALASRMGHERRNVLRWLRQAEGGIPVAEL
jgi:hypothetical protein